MEYVLGAILGLLLAMVILLVEYTYEPAIKVKMERAIRHKLRRRKTRVFLPQRDEQKKELLNELPNED